MKFFVLLSLGLGLMSAVAGCGKDPPKKPADEPKKSTPVPTDMVFNDFVPPSGPSGGFAVKMDGGLPEGAMGAAGDPAGAGGDDPAAATGDAPPKLRLTEPGAEPRALRKYTFAANRSDKRVMTVRSSVGREGQGPPQEVVLAITADFAPKTVKPTATKFEIKLLKIDLPGVPAPQKAQAMAQLTPFTGLTGTFDVSSQGEIGAVDFKADDRMAGQAAEEIVQALQQSLELLLPPFPDAPIGLGAKWERTIERKERGGGSMVQRHVFTLKELSGEGGVVTSDVDLGIPKHPVQARGVPPGATQEVKGKGTYTYAFTFNRVATKVTGDMAVTDRIEVPDGKGGKQSIVTLNKMKSELAPPAGAAPEAKP